MKIIKRTNSDGSVSWTTVVPLPRDPLTGRRQQKRVTAATKREVEQEAARIRHEQRAGTYREPSRMTVSEYLERWLVTSEARVRPQSFAIQRRVCRKLVGPAFGHIPLGAVTPLHIEDWCAKLLADGRSSTTVQSYFGVLHSAFKQAARQRLIPANPADSAVCPKRRHPEMRTWDAEQARQFLAANADEPLTAYWRLAVLTGLRRGEALALAWDDVDLERGTLSIRRGLIQGKQGWEFGPPKSRAGQRQIALDQTCVVALRAHRARQAEQRLAAGPAWTDRGLVFPGATGNFIAPRTLHYHFLRAVRRAGVPKLRLHDLRHASATLALAAGVHPKIVQERLGHASIKITMDRYSHVMPNVQRDAAERLAMIVGG